MVGVPVISWRQWERDGAEAVVPSPIQRRLDNYVLARADGEVRERFFAAANRFVRPVLVSAPPRLSPHLSTGCVFVWTGHEVRLLREARRMSIREFAVHLGVSDRMVSKWEAGGRSIRPRPINQQALDTSLRQADPDAREWFYAAVARHVSVDEQAAAADRRDLRPTSDAPQDVPPDRGSVSPHSGILLSRSAERSPAQKDRASASTNRLPSSRDSSRCWEVVVPVWVRDNEAVEVTAERIATAVGWLPGVQVDGVTLRQRETGTSH